MAFTRSCASRSFSPDTPRASGYVTWRGVVERRKIADLGVPVSAHVDMGPRLSFVYYWVSGGARLNWLALGQADGQKRESWSQTASSEEVIAAFDGWYDRPKRVIEATDETFRHPPSMIATPCASGWPGGSGCSATPPTPCCPITPKGRSSHWRTPGCWRAFSPGPAATWRLTWRATKPCAWTVRI